MPGLTLTIIPGRFSVCRLDAQEAVPGWALDGDFFSVTRTAEELSIVCRETDVPEGEMSEAGWVCFKVEGPLDFALTGVMAALAGPLADAGISLFAVSTYDTDYLLVKALVLGGAVVALTKAGHTVREGRQYET